MSCDTGDTGVGVAPHRQPGQAEAGEARRCWEGREVIDFGLWPAQKGVKREITPSSLEVSQQVPEVLTASGSLFSLLGFALPRGWSPALRFQSSSQVPRAG